MRHNSRTPFSRRHRALNTTILQARPGLTMVLVPLISCMRKRSQLPCRRLLASKLETPLPTWGSRMVAELVEPHPRLDRLPQRQHRHCHQPKSLQTSCMSCARWCCTCTRSPALIKREQKPSRARNVNYVSSSMTKVCFLDSKLNTSRNCSVSRIGWTLSSKTWSN